MYKYVLFTEIGPDFWLGFDTQLPRDYMVHKVSVSWRTNLAVAGRAFDVQWRGWSTWCVKDDGNIINVYRF